MDDTVNQVTKYVKKGMKLAKLGKLNESLECYDKAIKIDPVSHIAWSSKARALDEMNNMNEAMKCYSIALEINPNNASVWNNKGYAFRKQSKYHNAIECYDTAIKLQPNYAKAWYNKGYILEKQGKYEEALHCFDKAIEFNPQNEKYVSSRNSVDEKHKEIHMAFDNNTKEGNEILNTSNLPDETTTEPTSPTENNNGDSSQFNLFSITEKLHTAINNTKTFETLTIFETQIEGILTSVKARKEMLGRQKEEDELTCVICLDKKPTMICIPCGHMCLCESCKSQMTKKRCPICNQPVKNIYKVSK